MPGDCGDVFTNMIFRCKNGVKFLPCLLIYLLGFVALHSKECWTISIVRLSYHTLYLRRYCKLSKKKKTLHHQGQTAS